MKTEGSSAVKFYPDEWESLFWYNCHSHGRGYCSWQRKDENGETYNLPRELLRQQKELMQLAVPIQSSGPFWGANFEPNLPVQIDSFGTAYCYAQNIRNLVANGNPFQPIVGIQLHAGTKPEWIHEVCDRFSNRFAPGSPKTFAKLYMEQVTNSPVGVSEKDLFSTQMCACFSLMEELALVLQVHPEVTLGSDIFGCEKAFIPFLLELHKRFPRLKISLEHISTRELLEAVLALPDNIVGTFTVHHLIGDTADFWLDGRVYNPFNYCRSVLRSEADRLALITAITDPASRCKLSLGLDDAPHLRSVKLAKGSPGIWLPPWAAASLLLETGEKHRIPLEAIEAVVCLNGPRFYGLTIPNRKLKINRVAPDDEAASKLVIPQLYPLGGGKPILEPIKEGSELDGIVPYKICHQCVWQLTPAD